MEVNEVRRTSDAIQMGCICTFNKNTPIDCIYDPFQCPTITEITFLLTRVHKMFHETGEFMILLRMIFSSETTACYARVVNLSHFSGGKVGVRGIR